MTVKEEQQEPNIKCNDCGKICLNEKGLNIHKGKVHTVKPPVKRNRSEYELCQENENQCTNCGYECERKAALEWHQKKCTKRTKTFHDNRILTPANKKAMRNINQDIDSQKPHIDDINATRASKKESSQACTSPNITRKKNTDHMEIDNKNQCGQCEYENTDEYTLKQHKRDVHRDLSASVTPPPKKRMKANKEVENEVHHRY